MSSAVPAIPPRAALAFLIAKSAVDEGDTASLFLAGDAVPLPLLKDESPKAVTGLGTGKLDDHYSALAGKDVRFYLSGMSSRARGLLEQDVAGKPAEFAMPTVRVRLAPRPTGCRLTDWRKAPRRPGATVSGASHNRPMHIAILTFEGFNELDSLVALGVLNRVRKPGWRVTLSCPAPTVTSMNGVTVHAQSTLAEAAAADAVILGSGVRTRDIAADPALMEQLALDPARQLIGAQCSGTLLLAKLGLLDGVAACTDLTTKPWVQEAGVEVLNQPFHARGNVATAGGCFASQYLAAWVIARTEGTAAAEAALHYVAPVGEKDEYVARALRNIAPYLQ